MPYFSHQSAYSRGWTDYVRKTFPFADETTKWGTATPQYMTGGLWEEPNSVWNDEGYDERTVSARIADQLPDVRLIAILRDPVDRARSHHRMAQMNALTNGRLARRSTICFGRRRLKMPDGNHERRPDTSAGESMGESSAGTSTCFHGHSF